jgi:hypothetical protein
MVSHGEYAAVLWKLKAWLAAHPAPDAPIIGVAGGDDELSPRQIVREVEKRTPLGQELVDRWVGLVGLEHIMAAPVTSQESPGTSHEP